jgi:VIT1/CCC1 family predicted Fe2+/Mn2+ transporter
MNQRQAQRAQETLLKAHEPESIRRRIRERRGQGYTQDAVLGAIDGCVTTFAIVAGTMGGHFSSVVTIVLGMANLLADGFSMAASEYQATKAEGEEVDAARSEELRHIEVIPEAEREEIRQIYEEKGFRDETLEKAVETTVGNRDTWVNTMLTDELGLQPLKRSPRRAGLVTFVAFVAAGFVPLVPFLYPRLLAGGHFLASSVLTGVMFFSIGMAKGVVLHRPRIASALETLFTGIVAALLAYGAGALLKSLYGTTAV